jgi:TM2 domain-containing membrane protein YozV
MKTVDRSTVGIVALVLGILGFGWLGIHKFMMGKTKEGIITIIVGVVTCGLPMTVVSIIEGIIYLTKTDSEFQREYIIGDKGWF